MKRRRDRKPDEFPCPHCGADVPADRLSCPHCGSDAQTGWSDDADKWGADIPGSEDFDYDDFVAREFPENTRRVSRRSFKRLAIAVIVVLVCLGMLMAYLLGLLQLQ